MRQVLIKVHAAGVNPVDTYIRSGNYARKPALPYTPGSDAAGVVEAVGEKVSAFKVSFFLFFSVLFRFTSIHSVPTLILVTGGQIVRL